MAGGGGQPVSARHCRQLPAIRHAAGPGAVPAAASVAAATLAATESG
jgi:hypothetical protein